MNVGLVDLSPYGGKIKFEFWLSRQRRQGRTAEFKFYFPAMCTQVNKGDFHKIISLFNKQKKNHLTQSCFLGLLRLFFQNWPHIKTYFYVEIRKGNSRKQVVSKMNQFYDFLKNSTQTKYYIVGCLIWVALFQLKY